MLLTAYEDSNIISAKKAERGVNYSCPECGCTLRLKKGLYRKAHFYHLSARGCRQEKKGPDHLALQKHLSTLIPHLKLEEPFPLIGRIADCYWPARQIIFEVQCARLSFDEIEERTKDYRSLNLSVIWIFHTKSYKPTNARLIRALNRARIQFYFTNIRRYRQGMIFDYLEKPDGLRFFPISAGCPRPLKDQHRRALLPAPIAQRTKHQYYFLGDVLDRYAKKELYISHSDSLYKGIDRLFYRLFEWVHR